MKLDATSDKDPHVGGSGVECGFHHCVITEVDASQNEFASIVITFQVLASTAAEQAGKTFREFFSVSEKAQIRLKRLAMITGALKPGEARDVDFTKAVGADLIVRVVDHSYEKNGTTKNVKQIGFLDLWRVGHPDVKHVPLGEAPKSPKPAYDL